MLDNVSLLGLAAEPSRSRQDLYNVVIVPTANVTHIAIELVKLNRLTALI